MDSHPLIDLSEHFLSLQNLSKSTIKSYRICFKYYIKYLDEHDILYATTGDVIRFRDTLRRIGHSTYYIHTFISALKGLYRYLRIHQHIEHLDTHYAYDIMVQIKHEKITRHVSKTPLTLIEARQLLTHMKVTRKLIYDYRNYAIVCLMLTAGLSGHDIIHLKLTDYQIIEDKPALIIKRRRSEQTDIVYLSGGTTEAINDYLSKRHKKNPYLFISQNQTTDAGHLSRTFFYDMSKRVFKQCGIKEKHITPHVLRHTAAHLNLLRGASVESTKRLLRHVNIESTLIYQDYIKKMNDHTEESIESYILNESPNNLGEYHFWHFYLL
ncbi:MAG: tyrosine-type recombinase/integrase [Acholeplasma sp.]|nr:tyrosine-type recombinase/integrase [Acholeplasma sp.]